MRIKQARDHFHFDVLHDMMIDDDQIVVASGDATIIIGERENSVE